MLREASSSTRIVSGAASAAKKLICCGTPSSRTTKSSALRPETKRPRSSLTATPRLTASTWTSIRKGVLRVRPAGERQRRDDGGGRR